MVAVQSVVQRVYSRYRASQPLNAGVWYLGLSFIQKGISVVSVFLFSRILLPDQFGVSAIFSTWIGLFSTTITLNVAAAVGRARYDYSEQEFKGFLSSLMTLGSLSGIACAIVLTVLPDRTIDSVFGLNKGYVVLATIVVICSLAMDSVLLVWQVDFKYRRYAVIKLVAGVLSILVPLLLILYSPLQADPTLGKILGPSLVSIFGGLLFLTQTLSKGKLLFKREYWRYVLVYSIPLIPHTLSGIILQQSDRILVNNYIGHSAAGLYSFSYQLGEFVYMVWIATNSVWAPWFYRQMNQKAYPLIERRGRQYLWAFTAITMAAIIVGPLFSRIAPPQYWGAASVIPLVMCSEFFTLLYSFYANIEFYEKTTAYISVGTLLSVVVNVGLNMLLLPRFGYITAAWTTLISYIVMFLFHAWVVHTKIKTPKLFDFRLMIVLSVFIVTLSILVFAAAR